MGDGLKSIFIAGKGMSIGREEFLKRYTKNRPRFGACNAIKERGSGVKFLIVEVANPESEGGVVWLKVDRSNYKFWIEG